MKIPSKKKFNQFIRCEHLCACETNNIYEGDVGGFFLASLIFLNLYTNMLKADCATKNKFFHKKKEKIKLRNL